MAYRRSIDKGNLEAPANGNWVLVGDPIIVTAATLDKTIASLDGLRDKRYKIIIDYNNSAASANPSFYVQFNGITSSIYYRTLHKVDSTQHTYTAAASDTKWPVSNLYEGRVEIDIEDSAYVGGHAVYGRCVEMGQSGGVSYGDRYEGVCQFQNASAVLNSIRIASTVAVAKARIEVYRWTESAVPAEVVSYELVKEYKLSAQVLSDVIPWDGETDDICRIIADFGTANPGWLFCSPNSDVAAASYANQSINGSGATASASASAAYAGLTVGYAGTDWQTITDMYLKVGQGGRKSSMIGGSGSGQTAQACTSTWLNTAAKVTNLLLHTNGVAISGHIRVYRLARTSLISTNPNLNTLWHKYVDANTVEVQPGEIEINGAIMKVSKAKQVTLSANLKSGLTEAASTLYYMYAVRTPGKTDVTYMFDTQAPLMDRYGNIMASMDVCDTSKAWMHPTLGPNYRWCGQILNDVNSNVLVHDKARPGYFEGPWFSFSTNADIWPYNLGIAVGATPKNSVLLGSTSATGSNPLVVPAWSANGNSHYGVCFISLTSALAKIALGITNGGVFNAGSGWVQSGYLKIIASS